MDKETLLCFINTLIDRHSSDSVSVRQLRDILAEQQAAPELLELIDQVLYASNEIRQMKRMKKKGKTLSEEDIREAERKHRRFVEENAGRC